MECNQGSSGTYSEAISTFQLFAIAIYVLSVIRTGSENDHRPGRLADKQSGSCEDLNVGCEAFASGES